MSKWIDEISDAYFKESPSWDEDYSPTLRRIDELLKRAMRETDDEILHDDIRKEINGE